MGRLGAGPNACCKLGGWLRLAQSEHPCYLCELGREGTRQPVVVNLPAACLKVGGASVGRHARACCRMGGWCCGSHIVTSSVIRPSSVGRLPVKALCSKRLLAAC